MSKEAMKLALEALEEQVRMANGWQSPAEAKAIAALREALANEALDKMAEPTSADYAMGYVEGFNDACKPAQQEPAALKWQQAPVKTQWGDEMVVASVAIDKDHTVCLYCERDQTPKVDAMFAQRTLVELTDEDIDQGLLRSDYACKTAEAWRAGVVFAMTKLRSKNNA